MLHCGPKSANARARPTGVSRMLEILWFVAVSYVLPVVGWWYGLFYQRRLKMDRLRLPPRSQWPADRAAPSLAVIVACHNEERSVEACVRKLLAQGYPNTRIIIANDRSSDRTGEILSRLAAGNDRVRVLEITALPEGWTGKTHALSRAVRECDAEYILFVDSDVELAPHALNTAMDKVCRDRLDFLSLWPHLELRSFSERLLTPPAMLMLSMWAIPRTHGKDIASEALLGNGQFMLVKRDSYEALGGHAQVGAELAEDAILAAKAHDAGQRCWSGPGRGLYVTYREGDFGRTVNAVARVVIGSLQTQWRILLGTQILMGGIVAPAWILPAAAVCLASGLAPALSLTFLVLSVLHAVGMMLTLHGSLALTLAKRGSLLWFPIGAAVCVGVLLWCSYLRGGHGSVRWGTTRYRVQGSRVVRLTTG